MLDDPLRYLPYPELVEPRFKDREYEIHDSRFVGSAPSSGMVNQVDRIMLVPLTADGQSVRRHELAHVKWSPRRLPKTAYDSLILMAVEDARINSALRRCNLDCSDSPRLCDYVLLLAKRDLSRRDPAMYLLRCVASLGTDVTEALLEVSRHECPAVHPTVERLVRMVEARLEGSRARTRDGVIATFSAAVRIADDLAEEMGGNGYALVERSKHRLVLEGGLCISCRARDLEAEGLRFKARIVGGQDREAAKMFVFEPPLSRALPLRGRHSNGQRARTEGTILRSPNRWFSDRMIFRGRRRCSGGTVLVDTSSSMHLSADDVDRIVSGAPGATLVAIYSGREGGGELRIVARNGRRAAAADLTPFGPGNMIDLPALEWLARQPAPRVWLSDARVTGVNDAASRILGRRCRVVCLRHGIRRAETAEQAAALLEGRVLKKLPLMV